MKTQTSSWTLAETFRGMERLLFKNVLAVARHGPPNGQGRRYFRRKGNKTFDIKSAFEFNIGKGAEQLASLKCFHSFLSGKFSLPFDNAAEPWHVRRLPIGVLAADKIEKCHSHRRALQGVFPEGIPEAGIVGL